MENKNISCAVKTCKNHSKDNFCCLSSIIVGLDKIGDPTGHCTCCKSYCPKEKHIDG